MYVILARLAMYSIMFAAGLGMVSGAAMIAAGGLLSSIEWSVGGVGVLYIGYNAALRTWEIANQNTTTKAVSDLITQLGAISPTHSGPIQ